MEMPWIASEKFSLFQYDRETSSLSGWGAITMAGAGAAGGLGSGGVWGDRPGITSFSGWV